MLAYGLGVGTVPWLLLGELCPTKVKGIRFYDGTNVYDSPDNFYTTTRYQSVLQKWFFVCIFTGIASGCVTCAAFLTVFLVVKLFPELSKLWGLHVTYIGFGVVCVAMAVFTYLYIPETKGKSMAELQALFEQKENNL